MVAVDSGSTDRRLAAQDNFKVGRMDFWATDGSHPMTQQDAKTAGRQGRNS
jgi:hypothetical protein